MKRTALVLAAAVAAIVATPIAASAAPWQSINQRQANLERRIDQGIRSGEVTRQEAVQLRGRLHDLERLEAKYRRSGAGLDMRERRDLDARFDRLSRQVFAQKHDRNVRRY